MRRRAASTPSSEQATRRSKPSSDSAVAVPRVIGDERYSVNIFSRWRSWLRRHGVGSFWLPVFASLAITSPWPMWCLVHSALMVRASTLCLLLAAAWAGTLLSPVPTLHPTSHAQATFSFLAHMTYRTMNTTSAAAGAKRGRTPTSMWLHALRLGAGLGRWVLMPLVFLHATFNYPRGTLGPEFFTGGHAWKMDMPVVDGPKLLARLTPFSAYLLPAGPLTLPLPLLQASLSSSPAAALTLTLSASTHALVCHPAFAFLAALLAALRLLQFALWLVAAPPVGKDSKLRVLIVGDSIPPKVDGVAVRVGHLVPSLLAQGHSVHIVNSIRSHPMGAAGVTQLVGVESELYRGHSITLPNPLGVLQVILAFRPHVIHIMDESFLQASAQMAATACLIPTVWSHHSRLDKFAQACELEGRGGGGGSRAVLPALCLSTYLSHATPPCTLPSCTPSPLCRPPLPLLPALLPAPLCAAEPQAHLCQWL